MLRRLLDKELAARGESFDALARQASQIVVFGSRAAGLASPGSDLDILCVGSGPRIKSGRLDLLWIPTEALEAERWLAGELANHIARYGRWLEGADDWRHHVSPGPAAIERKRRQLVDRITALDQHWSSLGHDYRRHFVALVRRDLQRLRRLKEGRPVPPTPLLDQEWALESEPLGALMRLAEADGFLGPKELTRLISHAAEAWNADAAARPSRRAG